MKKLLNVFVRSLWIVFFVIAFVPALIILIVTDIREENRVIRMFLNGNAGEYSNNKVTNPNQKVSDTLQFVPDPV